MCQTMQLGEAAFTRAGHVFKQQLGPQHAMLLSDATQSRHLLSRYLGELQPSMAAADYKRVVRNARALDHSPQVRSALQGRTPMSATGAIMYKACLMAGLAREASRRDVSGATGVSCATLARACKLL